MPIILLTGLNDTDNGIRALEKGAQDYLIKGNISTDLLVRSINYSIKRKQADAHLYKLNCRLNNLVMYDDLTGTLNRNPFVDLFKKNILRAKREKINLALLFLDLERFKQINDIYGHEIGDKTLIKAAKIIEKSIRITDLFGRFGGDEFVICLNNIESLEVATHVAQKINRAFSRKIRVENLVLDLGVSIGISIYPEDGVNAVDLLKNSDLAMYQAKKQSKNDFHIYNDKLKAELFLNQSLEYALENNEFKLNYQTIVDKNQNPYCSEALLRWESPEFKNIKPTEFIQLLERSGAIVKVGEWVFREVCRNLKRINDKMHQNMLLSVNISPYQMEDKFFVKKIDDIVKETNVNPNNILMEITEKKHIKNVEKVKNIMVQLKEIGIGLLALDNFGSGASSFSNLTCFPLDIVKIDNFFIEKLNIEKYRIMTSNLIELIKKSGLKVIAEGVETKKQFDSLRKMECDYYQGFYFSKPHKDILPPK